MDERSLEASAATTLRFADDACEHIKTATKTYTVFVVGLEPLTIEAVNAEERGNKMAEAGIDLVLDKWAAGYLDAERRLQICGNDVDARGELRKLLRRR